MSGYDVDSSNQDAEQQYWVMKKPDAIRATWSGGGSLTNRHAKVIGQMHEIAPEYDFEMELLDLSFAGSRANRLIVLVGASVIGGLALNAQAANTVAQELKVEHIWLSDVRFVGNRFQGRIDNQPRKIEGLNLGQIVSVEPHEISNWLYVDNGQLAGGYTVRVHYNELSPQQKQER